MYVMIRKKLAMHGSKDQLQSNKTLTGHEASCKLY